MHRYKGNSIVGIMRECHGMWERRSPLSPSQVQSLIKQSPSATKVLVQPCTRRIFSNEEYQQAGAIISEDLSTASVILGVKSPPKDVLLPEKSYMFFSHTIKAQPYSMPLLDTILKKKIALFDYECITKDGRDDQPRLVAFGAYAGRAGMIDGLQGLGLRLLAEGYSTPFLHIPNTYMHTTLGNAYEELRKVGQMIHEKGLPDAITPLVVSFTGSGNVAKGAREVFENLPHEYVTVEELPNLRKMVELGIKPRNILYGVVCTAKDMVRHATNPQQAFDKSDYYRHPYNYESKFHETVLPYTTLFVNGIYWDNRFPRLMTNEQLKNLRESGNNKLKVLADITCDIGGSTECLHRPSCIEAPFYSFNPSTGQEDVSKVVSPDGVLILGVDNLPSELPRDASNHFGNGLLPLLPSLLEFGGARNVEEMKSLTPEMYRACITAHGELMPKWTYIQRLREQHEMASIQAAPIVKTPSSRPSSPIIAPAASVTVELVGHLFDTGVINQVFDVLESHTSHASVPGVAATAEDEAKKASAFGFNILVCDVRPNNLQGAQHSRVVIQLTGLNVPELQEVAETVCHMVSRHPRAEGTATIIPSDPSERPHDSEELVAGKSATPTAPSASAAAPSSGHIEVTMPKRILLFGAGRVALPIAKYFRDQHHTHLTVATEDEVQAHLLVDTISAGQQAFTNNDGVSVRSNLSRGRFVPYSFPRDNSPVPGATTSRLAELIHHSDVVVSLLPATMHVPIAKECLRQGKDMVTASYVSPEMRALHEEAKRQGVVFLNEVGLDPGMDHMMIMSAIDHIRNDLGAEITELVSLCGGLPDPITASTNPLKYKISWSPRGVLTAALNPARYLQLNELKEIPGDELLTAASYSHRFPTLRLEVVPNRDSLVYRSLYGLEDCSTLHSLCRGTLRYEGWANAMYALKLLGLLSLQSHSSPVSAAEVVRETLHKKQMSHNSTSIYQYLAQFPLVKDVDAAVEAVRWLGLSGDAAVPGSTRNQQEESLKYAAIAQQARGPTPLDALSSLWEQRLQYDMSPTSNEKDMVAMYHQIAGRLPDGQIVRHQSRLLTFGAQGGDTAMAATVGYTTAAAIDLLLREKDKSLRDVRGVVIPTDKRIYDFILKRIQNWGVTWSESVATEPAPSNSSR